MFLNVIGVYRQPMNVSLHPEVRCDVNKSTSGTDCANYASIYDYDLVIMLTSFMPKPLSY